MTDKITQTSLEKAEQLFRKVYMKALMNYEASLRELETSKKASPPLIKEVEGFEDVEEEEEEMSWLRWSTCSSEEENEEVDWRDLKVPTNPFEEEPTWLSEPVRVRWTKDEILAICNWPKSHWTKLKNRLELNVGLIKLQLGAGNPWKGEVIRCWTFSTRPEDREMGILNSPALQAQERLRLKQAARTALLKALEPLNEEEKEEKIQEELEAQKIELDEILKTLRTIKKDLLTSDMLKMLEAENKND